METEYVPAHLQTDTINYQVLHVVGGVLVTKLSFWARDDKHARQLAGPGVFLVHVVEE